MINEVKSQNVVSFIAVFFFLILAFYSFKNIHYPLLLVARTRVQRENFVCKTLRTMVQIYMGCIIFRKKIQL